MGSPAATPPILEVSNVSKHFGGVHALRGVSLTLNAGEVLALAGDNGAGKSTLIKIISGVYQPDDGTLSYQGKEIRLENPHRARDCGIETIYQDLALAITWTSEQTYFWAASRSAGSWDYRLWIAEKCAMRPRKR